MEVFNTHSMSHMVVRLRQVAPPTQEPKQASVDQQDAASIRGEMLQGEISSTTVESPSHGQPDECVCAMMDLDPSATSSTLNQHIEATVYPKCTNGSHPLFVFRSSPKNTKRTSLTPACRSVVHHLAQRIKNRSKIVRGFIGISGRKRKCGFLGLMAHQGKVKTRVADFHGDRGSLHGDSSFRASLEVDVFFTKIVMFCRTDVGDRKSVV